MVRSKEFLKALMRRILGVFCLSFKFVNMRSLMTEMKGEMPLPPLTITSSSCLQSKNGLPLGYV